jgi:hypothetical protein
MVTDLNGLQDSFGAIKTGLDLIKSALSLAKDATSLLPDDPKTETIHQSLEQAERATKLAEAQIAQALGYTLCQCTFPPQIMLRCETGEDLEARQFKCSSCGRKEPSDEHFRQMRRLSEYNKSGSWMSR